MRDRTLSVLEALNDMKPLRAEACQTWLETKILAITNALRWIGGILFLALCVIALVVRFTLSDDPSRIWLYLAELFSLGSMLCALTWLVLDTVPALVMLILFKKYMFGRRQHEANHDLGHVEKLLELDQIALRQAETWLSIKIDRIKARMTMIFGSPDTVVKVGLVVLSFLVSHDLPVRHDGWGYDALLYGTMFLGGLAIGGLLSIGDMQNISYQKELLMMALARLDHED